MPIPIPEAVDENASLARTKAEARELAPDLLHKENAMSSNDSVTTEQAEEPEVHDAYNERIDAANLQRTWGASKVNSWYKNEKGRVTQNWPFNLVEYWQQTRKPDPTDYVFL